MQRIDCVSDRGEESLVELLRVARFVLDGETLLPEGAYVEWTPSLPERDFPEWNLIADEFQACCHDASLVHAFLNPPLLPRALTHVSDRVRPCSEP